MHTLTVDKIAPTKQNKVDVYRLRCVGCIVNGNHYMDPDLHHWILQMSVIREGGFCSPRGSQHCIVLDPGPERQGWVRKEATKGKPTSITFQGRPGTPTPRPEPTPKCCSSLGNRLWTPTWARPPEYLFVPTYLIFPLHFWHMMHSKGYRCKLNNFKDHLTMWLVPVLRRGFIHTILENKGGSDAQEPKISSFCKVKK